MLNTLKRLNLPDAVGGSLDVIRAVLPIDVLVSAPP